MHNQWHPPRTQKALNSHYAIGARARNWLIGALSAAAQCQLCGQAASHNAVLCQQCHLELPIITSACPTCGLAMPANTACGDCLNTPKPYQRSQSALLYQNPVNELIHKFKNQAQWQVGHYLCDVWCQHNWEALARAQSHPSCAIVPIPSIQSHIAKRGFCHTINLAKKLQQHARLPLHYALKTTREAPSQKTLSRKQRLKNLNDVFQMTPLEYEKIILVDDVITSCATAIAASNAVRASGIKNIEIWAIARTPLEQ